MIPALAHSSKLLILNVLGSVVLPPGLFSLLIFGCLAFQQHAFATGLLLATGVLVYLFSVPATQNWVIGLSKIRPWAPFADQKNQAIVVVGGGHHINTPDYGGDTVNHLTLERVRYAAIVQKQTGLPVLVSGGKSIQGTISEAELMRDILNREFQGQVEWIEAESRTTYENASFSARILKANGIHRIILVTHAYHMPRAMEAFQHAGLGVTPAATIFFNGGPDYPALSCWIPSFNAFYRNNLIVHELVGRLWYYLRYYSTRRECRPSPEHE